MSASGRVVAAMSGGVDSSVAAAMLVEAGHEVIGVTLRVLSCGEERSPGGNGRQCCAAADVEDARRVADGLGIPHYVVDVREEFRERVVEPFLRAYAGGTTPLPCAPCNHRVKFGVLLDRALALDAEAVATGHYARVEVSAGVARLKMAADESRDQSYFLYGIPRERLGRVRFPLGGLSKGEVRARAAARGLAVAAKPDSQEVCFIPDGDTAGFLDRRLGKSPGRIVDLAGRAVGEHPGLHRFTVGQRRGLGLPADVVSRGDRLHVIALNPAENTVVVGPEEELYSSECAVADTNLLVLEWPPEGVAVRIRSRHSPVACTVRSTETGGLSVAFSRPQRAVTPGQAAVFYHGDTVLGGGTIVSAGK